MEDRAVAADGQDDIGAFQTLLLGQILHPHGQALCLQAVLHQHLRTMRQQDLRCPLGDPIGHGLAGVGRDVNCHRGLLLPEIFSGPA